MRIQALGHTVVRVRDRERAEAFYNGVLGLQIVARYESLMTFFTLGNHHDFAIMVIDADGPDAPANGPGLEHVAFKVGDSLDELRQVKRELEEANVTIDAMEDHVVSQSLYLRDPDVNGLELYVDTSDVWRTNPEAVASISPLQL